jgi:hypothetical protein
MSSRFNKNGKNLQGEAEQKWLEANAVPVAPEVRAEPTGEAETTKPDEGSTTKVEEDKPKQKRRRNPLSRTKKGENDG